MHTLTYKEVDAADEEVLFQLFSSVRAEELDMQSWDPVLRTRILRLQFDAQHSGYRQQFPDAAERLVFRDGAPIGWVIVDKSRQYLQGVDIALVSDERGKGIGTGIIRALQDEAVAEGTPMRISVRRGNGRAISLYKRLGFREVGETDEHLLMEWQKE